MLFRSGVAQTFASIPGRRYEVQFMMAGNSDDNNLVPQEPSLKTLRVQADGQSQDFSFDVDTEQATYFDMKWKEFSFTFVATSAETTLEIFSTMAPVFGGPVLDAVSVRELFPSAHEITLESSEIVTGVDFGNQQQIGTGEIRGTKFHDLDGDGVRTTRSEEHTSELQSH